MSSVTVNNDTFVNCYLSFALLPCTIVQITCLLILLIHVFCGRFSGTESYFDFYMKDSNQCFKPFTFWLVRTDAKCVVNIFCFSCCCIFFDKAGQNELLSEDLKRFKFVSLTPKCQMLNDLNYNVILPFKQNLS